MLAKLVKGTTFLPVNMKASFCNKSNLHVIIL